MTDNIFVISEDKQKGFILTQGCSCTTFVSEYSFKALSENRR